MTVSNKKSLISSARNNALLSSPSSEKSAVSSQVKNEANLTINLRHIPLLAQLPVKEIDQVKKELRVRRYARRQVIFQKGAQCDGLLFLLSGKLQTIDLTDEGRVIGLNLLSPGAFLGEIALINKSAHNTSAIALSEVLVAFLPKLAALYLFTHSPSVASQIQLHLAQKIHRDYQFRALLSINNTTKRIFSFLVLMKQKTTEKQELVENLPTHQEIANMINTSRETVTRTLLTLVQQGIIRKDSHRLIIINPEALKKLVKDP